MKFYKNYIYVIFALALLLNWVVASESTVNEKVTFNLGLLPKFSIIIIELLQILLMVRLLVTHGKVRFINVTLLLVVLFSVFELFVGYVAKSKPPIWVSGVRYYFSFIPIFLLGYVLGTERYEFKKQLNFLLCLVLFQIPVVVYQYFRLPFVKIDDRQLLYDMISGTMGGIASNLMALTLCIGVVYYLMKYLLTNKLKYIIITILLIIPAVLAEAKGMYVILFILMIYFFFTFRRKVVKMLKLVLIFIVLLIGFVWLYSILGYGYGKGLDISYLFQYTEDESGAGRLSRIQSIWHAFEVIFDNGSPVFGMGIGNANKGPFGLGKYYDYFTLRHSVDVLITETGIMGIVFLGIVIFRLMTVSNYVLKREVQLDTNSFQSLIARMFFALIFVFCFGLLWVDVLFRIQFMYPFGFMAGYIIGLYKTHKENEPGNNYAV